MKKTSLKTFVCSFVFSLFMIFTINGIYLRTQKPVRGELKISNKNITLFFKSEPKTTAYAKVIPIKKITLTLPQTKTETFAMADSGAIPLMTEDNNELTVASADDAFSPPPEADFSETTVIPLEIQGNIHPPQSLSQGAEPKVTADFDKMINSPPPVPKEEIIITTESSPKKESPVRPQELILAHQNEMPEEATFKVAKVSGNAFKINNLQKDIDVRETPAKEEAGELLIPLEKDNSITAPGGEIQIVKSPDRTQLAMADKNIPVKSLIAKDAGESDGNRNEDDTGWKSMSEKDSGDTPWLTAKGMKHPRNNNVLQEDYYKQMSEDEIKKVLNDNASSKGGEGIKLADAGMVKNILIPIPEDILKEDPLTPQLVSSEKEKDKELEKEIFEKEEEESKITVAGTNKQITATPKKGEEKSLLKSITSIFSGAALPGSQAGETAKKENIEEDSEESFFSKISGGIKRSSSKSKILPAEIRLSFQPNRAEISGQTLKWIEAFANKTKEDATVGLEVRIDGTNSYALQQKRLNLLQNILKSKGVNDRKINTVFTTREPNSFVIRTVRINSNYNGSIEKKGGDEPAYYQQW